jgi:large subunit ribosomal protein L31e
MAKKEEKSKVVLEREYIIPLRKEFQKAPKYKRAKKTIKALKEFLAKHMKSDNIKIGKYLNLKVWEHGIKNPPHKVKVKTEKYDDGLVKAELVGAPVEKPKKEKKKQVKKEEKKEVTPKEEEKSEEKKEEKQPENKLEEKKEETKEAENKKEEEIVESKEKLKQEKKQDKREEEKK